MSPTSTPPPLPTPNYTILFYIIPIYATATPNSRSFVIVLTLKLFCIVLPYLYVVIEVLCGHFTIKKYYYYNMERCVGLEGILQEES